MTAASALITSAKNEHLRPIDTRRDLSAVADLVELCFKERMDEDGRRTLQQMRNAASNEGMFSRPIRGFVWEEQGEIIGNLNLVPAFAAGARAYLIANVAVNPNHRRRGIARQLTDAALSYIHERGTRYAWLQVDTDNPAAQKLYQQVGFMEVANRTTWHTVRGQLPDNESPNVRTTSRRLRDWEKQKKWLNATYPFDIRWHMGLNPKVFRPGLAGFLSRTFSDKNLRQWTATRYGKAIGTLTWQSSSSMADWLWLAAPPENDALAIPNLTAHARRLLPPHRKLAINYPAGRAEDILQAAGFYAHQTLIWMKIDLKNA